MDDLLSGAAFDPQEAFTLYWGGDYDVRDLRGSLFGQLSGQALLQAIDELRGVVEAHVQGHGWTSNSAAAELRGFDTTFKPLRDIAAAEAGGRAARPVVTADVDDADLDPDPAAVEVDALATQAIGSLPDAGPLHFKAARRVVHALLDHRPDEDPCRAWALLDDHQGLALLRALDQVELALYDDSLVDLIDETDRRRISELIQDKRRSVDAKEEDRLLAELLRGSSSSAPRDGRPCSSEGGVDPWTVIDRLRKGKHAEGDTAVVDVFEGRTGGELWDALDEIERVLRQDAGLGEHARVPADERETVLAGLESFRQRLVQESRASDAVLDKLLAQVEQMIQPGSEPPQALNVLNHLIEEIESSQRRPPALAKRRPLFDVRFRGALELGGLKALLRLLVDLTPLQQWQVLTSLVEDQALLSRYPALLALEGDVYRHYIASQRGGQPLKKLRDWYRLASLQSGVSPSPPPVPADVEATEWVRMLRIMLYQCHPERSRSRDEMGRALDLYQAALGVKTGRDLGEALWLDAVASALKVSACGHSLLEALLRRLGNESNAALALIAALADLKMFGAEHQSWLYRAAAILMARQDHSLPCIAVPHQKSRTPQRLNVCYPMAPGPDAPQAVWDRYQDLQDIWQIHEYHANGDQIKVRKWLFEPPRTKPCPDRQGEIELTVGEQCDRLLCDMALPPKRVEGALLKIVLTCDDVNEREMYLLARRLLSELLYSERNDARRNRPMSACDILLRMLGAGINGVREGSMHAVGLMGARVIAYYCGPWSVPVMGVISCGLSLWAWYHLDQAKSPDYRRNPSPVLDTLIQLVPTLNTVALSGLFLCTGILPMTQGTALPLDVGEALYLMNIMRLLRQLGQSGTQPLARLFRLTDRRGAGLPAQMTFWINCGRDGWYVLSSVGFLIRFADYLNGLMAQWGPPRSDAEAMLHLFLKSLPSILNEAADGINPDLNFLLVRLLSWLKGALGLGEDDVMLQPGIPLQWEAVANHTKDHVAGRSTIVGLQDSVAAASVLAEHLGQHGLAQFLRWVATLLNGFLGCLRGRELSYMRTTDPRAAAVAAHDGFNPRNPDGLLVAMGYAASALASRSRLAMRHCGLSNTPPPTILVSLPPQAREAMRERTNALLLSSRGRNAESGRRPRGGDTNGPLDSVSEQ